MCRFLHISRIKILFQILYPANIEILAIKSFNNLTLNLSNSLVLKHVLTRIKS